MIVNVSVVVFGVCGWGSACLWCLWFVVVVVSVVVFVFGVCGLWLWFVVVCVCCALPL